MSSRPGAALKAAVIADAARALSDIGVDTVADLRATDRLSEVKSAWLALPGQRSGISWRYFQMLAGVPGVKPDRMIIRFLRDVTTKSFAPSDAAAVVADAARRLDVDATRLDHRIWRVQSGRAG